MKRILFVRHGQTDGNIGNHFSTSASMLTDEGKQQAQAVARRLKIEKFDLCYSSTFQRAIDTAEYILEYHDNSLITDARIIEFRRPSIMDTLTKDDPQAIEIENRGLEHFGEDGYVHLDGENWPEIKERLDSFIDELLEKDFETALVVCHEFIMRLLLARFAYGREWNGAHARCVDHVKVTNTGIMEVRYMKRGWRVWTWNDHSHLDDESSDYHL